MAATRSLSTEIGIKPACDALGIVRSGFYRGQGPATAPAPRPSPPRTLSSDERQAVLATLHSARFVDTAPATVYATLLDEGRYHCSIRTLYRILDEQAEVKERRNQLRHPVYQKPELLATAPNQVWSWDLSAPCRRGRRKTNYAGWLPTGSWNAAPLGKDTERKGAAKLRHVPMAGCHKQSSLNSTGRGPLPTSRATTGSRVRQRSVRRKPLYLEQPTLNDGMAWRDCGAIRLVLMLPTEGCARRIRRWDVL